MCIVNYLYFTVVTEGKKEVFMIIFSVPGEISL